MIVNPVMVYANIIGSILNDILPSGVILSLLMILLFVGLLINIFNAIKRFRAETKAIEEEKENNNNKSSDEKPLKNKDDDVKDKNNGSKKVRPSQQNITKRTKNPEEMMAPNKAKSLKLKSTKSNTTKAETSTQPKFLFSH